MLIILLLVILLFGGFGTYHGFNGGGPFVGGGIGLGTILLVVLLFYLLSGR